jgi:hypothetical protein
MTRMHAAEVDDPMKSCINGQGGNFLRYPTIPGDQITKVEFVKAFRLQPGCKAATDHVDGFWLSQVEPQLIVDRREFRKRVPFKKVSVDHAHVTNKLVEVQLFGAVRIVVAGMDLVQSRDKIEAGAERGEAFQETRKTTPAAVQRSAPTLGVVKSAVPLLPRDRSQKQWLRQPPDSVNAGRFLVERTTEIES